MRSARTSSAVQLKAEECIFLQHLPILCSDLPKGYFDYFAGDDCYRIDQELLWRGITEEMKVNERTYIYASR